MSETKTPTMRPCWLYVFEWKLADLTFDIVGGRVVESRGSTSAGADDLERRCVGYIRSDTRKSDEEIREWMEDRGPDCIAEHIETAEIVRSRSAGPFVKGGEPCSV